MSIAKLTWRNLCGIKGRYLILILVSACLFAALLAANGATENVRRQIGALNLEYGGSACLSLAAENPERSSSLYPTIDYDTYLALGDEPYVDDVQVEGFFYFGSKEDTKLYRTGGDASGKQTDLYEFSLSGWYSYIIGYNMDEANVLTECSTEDFTEGRCFENKTECVVSDADAYRNGLNVGDKLRFVHSATGAQLELTIVGIVRSSALEARFTDVKTQEVYVYTDMEGVAGAFGDLYFENIVNDSEGQPYHAGYNAVVRLDSAEHFSDFSENMLQKSVVIDGESYRLCASHAKGGYQELYNALTSVSSRTFPLAMLFALLFTAVTLAAGIINLRARRQQFGVLLSMGMPRREIIASYALEQLIVFLAGLLGGIILGSAVLLLLGLPVSVGGSFGAAASALYALAVLAIALAAALSFVLRLRPAKLLHG